MDHFFKASIVLIYIYIQRCTAESLHCLSCTDTVSPLHCHLIRKCPAGDVCYIEQFRTINGENLYNMGCYTERICHDRQMKARKRQSSHVTGSENPQCVHCCKSDACNVQGCHSTGFPLQRGPLCFNCKQSSNPELCRYVKVCEFDQVCHLHEEEEFGDKFYASSCLLQNVSGSDKHNLNAPAVFVSVSTGQYGNRQLIPIDVGNRELIPV
ncbi:prostate stem cell antigen-like [Saccostrea cucullata]|uniref:prostate stem cell antigen-like n=1 Tax=Saccostrea cuccullata TaxID=36930 RepID=UPI002ED3688C